MRQPYRLGRVVQVMGSACFARRFSLRGPFASPPPRRQISYALHRNSSFLPRIMSRSAGRRGLTSTTPAIAVRRPCHRRGRARSYNVQTNSNGVCPAPGPVGNWYRIWTVTSVILHAAHGTWEGETESRQRLGGLCAPGRGWKCSAQRDELHTDWYTVERAILN